MAGPGGRHSPPWKRLAQWFSCRPAPRPSTPTPRWDQGCSHLPTSLFWLHPEAPSVASPPRPCVAKSSPCAFLPQGQASSSARPPSSTPSAKEEARDWVSGLQLLKAAARFTEPIATTARLCHRRYLVATGDRRPSMHTRCGRHVPLQQPLPPAPCYGLVDPVLAGLSPQPLVLP